jgi:hypothetical protein
MSRIGQNLPRLRVDPTSYESLRQQILRRECNTTTRTKLTQTPADVKAALTVASCLATMHTE